MTFLDLFRPKWRSSNPEVRRSAVESLADQGILEKIANEDPDLSVRQTAARTLEDSAALVRLASKDGDEDVSLVAAEELHEEEHLSEATRAAVMGNVARACIVRITTPSHLLSAVDGAFREDICEIALDSIQSEELLAELVIGSSRYIDNEVASLSLLESLHGENHLAKVAQSTSHARIATACIARISNQTLLGSIASNTSHEDISNMALDKIIGEDALADLAINTMNHSTERQCIDRITELPLLFKIAMNCTSETLQHLAIRKIDDQRHLMMIARDRPEWSKASVALGRVNDTTHLIELVNAARCEKVKLTALMRINDQELLGDIVRSSKSREVLDAAFAKLTDNSMIIEFAMNSNRESVRTAAVEYVKDQEVLAAIALNDGARVVREQATGRLTDKDRLSNLALLSKCSSVKRIVEAKQMSQSQLDESLFRATDDSDVNEIRTLILAGANAKAYKIDDIRDTTCFILHFAIPSWGGSDGTGELPIIEMLLDAGADIDGRDNGMLFDLSLTPLMKATICPCPRIVELLIMRGANTTLRDKNGKTVFRRVLDDDSGDEEVFALLVKATADGKAWLETPRGKSWTRAHAVDSSGPIPANAFNVTDILQSALRADRCEEQNQIRVWVESGGNLDWRTPNGWTLLHLAAQCGNVQMVRFLVEHGADIEARDDEGETPLILACDNGFAGLRLRLSPAVVRTLLDLGANRNAVDNPGRTAMSFMQRSRSDYADNVLRELNRPSSE